MAVAARTRSAEQQGHRPELRQRRQIQVRTGVGEEHHEDHPAGLSDGAAKLLSLGGEVFHDEARDDEGQHRVVAEGPGELGGPEGQRDQKDDRPLSHEPQVDRGDEAEGRPHGRGHQDLVPQLGELGQRQV